MDGLCFSNHTRGPGLVESKTTVQITASDWTVKFDHVRGL
jgi:hypothetical protein